jgi:hypothetical protein
MMRANVFSSSRFFRVQEPVRRTGQPQPIEPLHRHRLRCRKKELDMVSAASECFKDSEETYTQSRWYRRSQIAACVSAYWCLMTICHGCDALPATQIR